MSKFGCHVLYLTPTARGWIRRRPLVMKSVDDRASLYEAAAAGVPIRIFRHYFPVQDVLRHGADVVDEVLAALGDAPATHVELFNETAQRLGEGLEEHVRLTREAGFHLALRRPDLTLVAYSFSTGQPRDDDWLYLWQHAFGYAPTIGLHEYWGPGLTGNRTRHRYVHTLLGGQHPPFLITECGRDAAGDVRVGWRGQGVTTREYLRELALFAGDIEHLDYVLAATVFTTGARYDETPLEWDSFDCDPLGLDLFDLNPTQEDSVTIQERADQLYEQGKDLGDRLTPDISIGRGVNVAGFYNAALLDVQGQVYVLAEATVADKFR